MKVVIIDDEEDIGFILGFELKLEGHETTYFNSIESAKAFIAEHATIVEAIICDFQMPGMNGLELHNFARSKNYEGPFYILTGEPTMDIQSLLKSGITRVLFKPQDLNKLAQILKS